MSTGKKLRKMVMKYRDKVDIERQIKKEREEIFKQNRTNEEYEDILVHGYMVYECRDCGTIYKMWLEKGLEDHVQDKEYPDKHKPVPFGIRCKCGSFNCTHILWGVGEKDEYESLRKGESYFKNDPDQRCGTPVLRKSLRNRQQLLYSQFAEVKE